MDYFLFNTYKQQKYSLPKYEKYAAMQEYNQIKNNSNLDTNNINQRLNNYKNFPEYKSNIVQGIYLNQYYYINIFTFAFLLLLSLIIIIGDFIYSIFTQNK